MRYSIGSSGALHANAIYENWTGSAYLVAATESFVVAHNDRYLFFLNPDDLSPVYSVLEVGRNLNDLDVQGDYVYYVRGADRDLVIVDATDLYHPHEIGSVTVPEGGQKLEVAGSTTFVAGGYGGLRNINTSSLTNPFEVGFHETFSQTGAMVHVGDYGFLAEQDDGLVVIDLNDVAHPFLAGQLDTPGNCGDLTLAGDLIYIADGDGGVRIADISDPLVPEEVGSAPVSAWAQTLAVAGTHAYVVDNVINQPDWIRIFNVANPALPEEIAAYHLDSEALALAVDGDYLYIAADVAGLLVLDVSDPLHPSEAGSYPAPDVRDVEISGNYAYLASSDWDGGLIVLDISDPTAPAFVSRYTYGGGFFPFTVALSGEFAYLTVPTRDLIVVLYIGDPSHPAELGTYTPPGGMRDICPQDSLIYVSDGSAGLLILENQLYFTPGGGVGWEPQVSGTSEHLRAVRFADVVTGWTVGDDGTILKTDDAGEAWIPQNCPTGEDLFALAVTDVATAWAGGRQGVILHTVNGGAQWSLQSSGTTEQIRGLCFVDQETGWAVGGGGKILKTVDGGDHWQPQNSTTSEILMSVSFVDDQHGWATGYCTGIVLRTTDGGTHWTSTYLPAAINGTSVRFLDTQIGWATGSDAYIFKTTTGGSNWSEQYSDPATPYSSLNAVDCVDANTAWVVGAVEIYGRSMGTADGGDTWIPMHGGNDHYLQSVDFIDQGHGWAVGHDGTILTAIAALSAVEPPGPPALPSDRRLLASNTPNPFQRTTTIRYVVPRSTDVTLRIYNIQGQCIRTLVSATQSPGLRTVLWDGEDGRGQAVDAGVYLYRVQIAGQAVTGRALLLR